MQRYTTQFSVANRGNCGNQVAEIMATLTVSRTTQKKYSWKVDWTQGRTRKRRFFTAEKPARDFARVLRSSLDLTPRGEPPPTPEELRAVYHARSLSIPLMSAVELWTRQNGRARGKTFQHLVDARIAALEADNVTESHREHTARWLRTLPADLLAMPAAEVDQAALRPAVFAGNVSPSTQQHRRAMLTAVFNQAMRDGILSTNPAMLIKAHRARAKPLPGILTPDQAAAYLAAIRTHAPAMLAADAIGLFAGLRIAEIHRLDWSAVRLDRGHIEVTAGSAKTKSRRLVDLMPCLEAILRPIALERGPVVPIGAVHLERTARKYLPFRVPPNAARHSFVSYHLALCGDVAKTELQAGHDRAVLFEHYRELVTKADAERCFATS